MVCKYGVILTGGIATGKSTVCEIFAEKNFIVVDSDKIAHDILDECADEIINLFGKEYVKNEKVDRKKLGDFIFSDSYAKIKLETLVHPKIYEKLLYISKKLEKLKKPYILDIPLYFEQEGKYRAPIVVVVYTLRETQIKRLMTREKMSKKEAIKRVNSQIDIEEKRKKADFVIDNSKGLNHLYEEVEKVIKIVEGKYGSIKI